MQTGPALQVMVAAPKHGFEGVQAWPGTHATQLPDEQTSPRPHPGAVPSGACPVTSQIGPPVEQEMAPSAQGTDGVQTCPSEQATHAPAPSQTCAVPQLVPGDTGVGDAWHTGPPLQDSVPSRQAFGGTQAVPSAHGAHAPSEQTEPAPHDVPFGAFPLSAQTGPPELQEIAPALQGSASVQLAPAAHATQLPAPSQTWAEPQLVPGGSGAEVSTQTGPALHERAPASHGFGGMHAVPGEQGTQEPVEQTEPAPHAVPSATFPLSVHTWTPVLHVTNAVWHGSPDGGGQDVPATQALQTPLPQTALVPQLVPSRRDVPES
jgi:hypothetical protein